MSAAVMTEVVAGASLASSSVLDATAHHVLVEEPRQILFVVRLRDRGHEERAHRGERARKDAPPGGCPSAIAAAASAILKSTAG